MATLNQTLEIFGNIIEMAGKTVGATELSGTKNFVPNSIPYLKPLFLFRSVPKFLKKTIPNHS